ncbi:MAG: HD-GYP domain-containing protein [Candidatus Limnocylindria bacterium]
MSKGRSTSAYVGAVALVGLACLAVASLAVDVRKLDPLMFLLLVAIAGLAQRLPVMLFRSGAVSVAFAATIAAYVLYGPGAALWVNLASVAVNAFTPRPKPFQKIAFNFGALTASAFLAAMAYQVVGGQVPPGAIPQTVLAVAVSAGVYFLANSFLTSSVIAISERAPVSAVWKLNYSWMAVNYLATAVNGASIALAYQALEIFGVVTFLLPLGVAWYSFKLYMAKSTEVRARNDELQSVNQILQRTNDRLEESHLSVIGALVGALEAKDHHTHGHSAATMYHAVAVARKLRLGEDEIAAVQLGALFHDIGKIGIPETILRKPDRLTDAEWTEMKAHPVIGANLLAHVPTLEKVRPIVLAHHERYDGTGYPNGLRGEQIPLAAQIIAVADAFEAMTASRPYRPALTPKQAMRELRAAAGTQFNPLVVESFITKVVEERRKAARGTRVEHEHMHVYKQAVQAVKVAG